jgi:hypothetical protein
MQAVKINLVVLFVYPENQTLSPEQMSKKLGIAGGETRGFYL